MDVCCFASRNFHLKNLLAVRPRRFPRSQEGYGVHRWKRLVFLELEVSKQKNGSYEVHPGILKMNILNPKSRWMEDVLQPFVFGIASFQAETKR